MTLFNRYCIRCHSVDGRGVWDIPDVPDFANVVWQNTRPDEYRSRVILEGRGAVMPSFRGIITVEESWALARYLHSFLPGNEVSRPGLRSPNSPSPGATPAPATPAAAVPAATTPAAIGISPTSPAAASTAAPTVAPPPTSNARSPFGR
ncbi:MAG: c-type cytochrome [Solirubrobacteraceae bacterium]